MLFNVLCCIRVCNVDCIVLQGCSWCCGKKSDYHPVVCCAFTDRTRHATNPQHLGHGSEGWEVSSRVANSDYYFWIPICICCHLSPGSNLRLAAFILLPQIFLFSHIIRNKFADNHICKMCLILSNLVTGFALLYKCAIQCSEITMKWKLK